MAGILQHRRSNTAGIAAATPAAGELLENTDDLSLHLGDGTAAGGWIVGGNPVTVNTGTSFAITGAHQGRLVTLSNAAPVAVSLVQGTLVNNFPTGAKVLVYNRGAGLVTITPATSTINGGATLALASGNWACIVSDGTNYVALSFVAGAGTLASLTDVALASLANNDILVYDSGAGDWVNRRAHYDLGFSAPQVTPYTASQVVGAHRFSCAVTIPVNLGAYLARSSRAGGSVVTTASTVFNIDKAASASPNSFSNVGTITFAIGTVTPTFASSGGTIINFAAGDVVQITAPATPDTTFAGFYATIVGFET